MFSTDWKYCFCESSPFDSALDCAAALFRRVVNLCSRSKTLIAKKLSPKQKTSSPEKRHGCSQPSADQNCFRGRKQLRRIRQFPHLLTSRGFRSERKIRDKSPFHKFQLEAGMRGMRL